MSIIGYQESISQTEKLKVASLILGVCEVSELALLRIGEIMSPKQV
jgi:hypothetical protein